MKLSRVLASVAVLAMVCVYCVSGGSWDVYVTNTATRVVPDAGVGTAPLWVGTNVYPQGAYVRTSAGTVYMALEAGTSGASMASGSTIVTNGTIRWLRCPGYRRGFAISNDDPTNRVYVSIGTPIRYVPSGIRIAPDGGSITVSGEDAVGGSVWASTISSTAHVTVADW